MDLVAYTSRKPATSESDSSMVDVPGESNESTDGKHQQTTADDSSWLAFQDCTIAFAIDISGSTEGHILDIEREAVSTISSLLTPTAQSRSRVIPWNSTTEPVTIVANLPYLRSYGGTCPTSLARRSESRHTIQNSTLWVLLTDGVIDKNEYQQFAHELALNSLHGVACIIMVFGDTRRRPAHCNISVGVSVFAAVPDCLFLYVDQKSGIVYLMQCSGRFTQILEVQGKAQPELDAKVRWADLPQIDLHDLIRVSVPVPRKLGKEELALQGGLVINLENLWSGRDLGEETIDQIFRHDDNLRSIMLTSQTRGRVESFQKWLKPFLNPENLRFAVKLEDGGESMKAIKTMLEEMQTVGITEPRKVELQLRLKNAHERNQVNLFNELRTISNKARRKGTCDEALSRSSGPVHTGQSISRVRSCVPSYSDENLDDWDFDQFVSRRGTTPSSSKAGGETDPLSDVIPLFTTGFFKIVEPNSSFDETCDLCARPNSTLVLFLRQPPSKVSTPGFPAAKSVSKIAYPLAMGNLPETDILTEYICCDSCSFLLAQSGKTPTGEDISCILPLVSYDTNGPAYLKQLRLAFDARFADLDAVMVFLAVLLTAKERVPAVAENELWHRAVTWLCRNLMKDVQHSETPSLYFLKTGPVANPTSIENVFLSDIQGIYQRDAWEGIFGYPLEGFVTLMLALNCMQPQPDLPHGIENVIWQRFLFALTEQYHEYRGVKGPLLHVAMTTLIFNVDPSEVRRPRIGVGSITSSFQDVARSMLGDTRPCPRILLGLDALETSPLLNASDIKVWQKLKEKFDWIDAAAGYAIGSFVHHLARTGTAQTSAQAHFAELKQQKALRAVFLQPWQIDAEAAKSLVGDLPWMDKEGGAQNDE
jgi:hypothetical protein